jgi:hypothetical protein
MAEVFSVQPKEASFSSIALEIVNGILLYLDMVSLANSCSSSKFLKESGSVVARCVYQQMATLNLSSPFVTLPEQTNVIKAIYDTFFGNTEVLIMGGSVVTKMIVEPNSLIRFEPSTPMLQARHDFDAVYHQGEVFSISNGSSEGTVERLDTMSQNQSLLDEDLPNNLIQSATVIYDNKLIVIGGVQKFDYESNPSDNVYEFDINASQPGESMWKTRSERLNTARSRAAAIIFEGKIFVCGGWGTEGLLDSVEVFDPTTGIWQIEGNMTKGRCKFSLFVYKNVLYAVGGDRYRIPTTIEKRNKNGRWQHVAGSEQRQYDHGYECSRYGCASMLIGSKIFLFGGQSRRSTFDYFDLDTKKWASKDVGCKYSDKINRQLPHQVFHCKAVLITPHVFKTWTHLNIKEDK